MKEKKGRTIFFWDSQGCLGCSFSPAVTCHPQGKGHASGNQRYCGRVACPSIQTLGCLVVGLFGGMFTNHNSCKKVGVHPQSRDCGGDLLPEKKRETL